ncbi:MAG: alanine racemase [Spirochaetaceae bacterium]|nr:MAG: alanine racemase [Spirochaetaceae bacterium]
MIYSPVSVDPQPARDTWYEIDEDALVSNYRCVREFLDRTNPHRRVAIAAVMKADAYGMGTVPVARILLRAGADLIAVACLTEASLLRRSFPDARIMIMGYTPDRLLTAAAERAIAITIFEERQAALLSEWSERTGRQAHVEIKLDTGFNRLGCDDDDAAVDTVERIARMPGLVVDGMFSHLALESPASDRRQFSRLSDFADRVRTRGIALASIHLCDSIGMVRYPDFHLDMVRPGAILYGAPPMGQHTLPGIRVPFAFKTRIARVRRLAAGEGVSYDFTWRAPESGATLATLPVGYADGYRRAFSNRAHVVIRGVAAAVVGLVCMDQCTVDVSAVPGVSQGDEVVLLGRSGNDEVALIDAATWAATNRNEVLAGIGKRVPRVYHRGGRITQIVDEIDAEVSSGS